MHILSYIHTVDKHLNSTLHDAGPNTSQFSWYMALQTLSMQAYSPKNDGAVGDDLPYQSIDLPSAPKASLYANSTHFAQSAKRAVDIQTVTQPSLLIQFYNCLHPQSLAGRSHAHPLPFEVRQNTSPFTQCKLKQDSELGDDHAFLSFDDDGEQAFRQPTHSHQVNDKMHSADDLLPASKFADNTFATIKQGLAF